MFFVVVVVVFTFTRFHLHRQTPLTEAAVSMGRKLLKTKAMGGLWTQEV